MKKLTLFLTATAIAIILSGCGDHYPSVNIDKALLCEPISIDMGVPYKYKDFDIVPIDGGKDLILHFVEEDEE